MTENRFYHGVKMLSEKEIFDAYLTIKERRLMQAKARRELKQDLRERLKNIFGEKCEICGSTRFLEFHHIKPLEDVQGGVKEREPYWILNHINEVCLLCKKCHMRIHATIERLKYGKSRRGRQKAVKET